MRTSFKGLLCLTLILCAGMSLVQTRLADPTTREELLTIISR